MVDFIDVITELLKNTPTNVPKALIAGQGVKETGYGKHVFQNNWLGIKAHGNHTWDYGKTGEVINGIPVNNLRLKFCTYKSMQECLDDYLSIMGRYRYTRVRNSKSYQEAAYYIRVCGYATSMTYWQSLIKDYCPDFGDLDYKMPFKSEMTKNFKWEETFGSVRLPNGTEFKRAVEPPEALWENITRVAGILQQIRTFYSEAIVVNSWYRTAEFNAGTAGSSKKSNHLKALAVDIRPTWTWDYNKVLNEIKKKFGLTGYVGSGFIHLNFI